MALFVPGVRLVAAALLAVVWIALTRARRALAGVCVASPAPAALLVGETLVLDLPIRNTSTLVAARDVTFHQAFERGSGLRAAYLLTDLGPRETQALAPTFRHHRRGRLTRYGIVGITTYPFGLAVSTVDFDVPVDLLVLPRPGRVHHLPRLLADLGACTVSRRSRATQDGDFLGLREWRDGESLRLVHWKTTARRGRPVVRELASEDARPVHVLLALGVSHLASEARPEAAFERAVQTAATLVDGLLREGRRVRLSVCGSACTGAGTVPGRSAVRTLLGLLAEAQPELGRAPTFEECPASSGRPEAVLCVVAGESADVSPVLPAAGALLLFADAPEVRRHFPQVSAVAPRPGTWRTDAEEVRS
jgi:uncharacterized protein (DUF58 family)